MVGADAKITLRECPCPPIMNFIQSMIVRIAIYVYERGEFNPSKLK
jgi:hypothetical protein